MVVMLVAKVKNIFEINSTLFSNYNTIKVSVSTKSSKDFGVKDFLMSVILYYDNFKSHIPERSVRELQIACFNNKSYSPLLYIKTNILRIGFVEVIETMDEDKVTSCRARYHQ